MSLTESRITYFRHGNGINNQTSRIVEETGKVPENALTDYEAGLSPLGIEQAEALGDEIAQQTKDIPREQLLFVSSDMPRALETTRIVIARVNGLRSEEDQIGEPVIFPELSETSVGIGDYGIAAKYPELTQRSISAHKNIANYRTRVLNRPSVDLTPQEREIAKKLGMEGQAATEGESIVDIIPRIQSMIKFFEEVIKKNGPTFIFVGTHGNYIWGTRMAILGETPEEVIGKMERDKAKGVFVWNGSQTEYTYDPEKGWVLLPGSWNQRLLSEQN